MAKLVVKQIVKAHGPRVFISRIFKLVLSCLFSVVSTQQGVGIAGKQGVGIAGKTFGFKSMGLASNSSLGYLHLSPYGRLALMTLAQKWTTIIQRLIFSSNTHPDIVEKVNSS